MDERKERISESIKFFDKIRNNKVLKTTLILLLGLITICFLFLDFNDAKQSSNDNLGLVYIDKLEEKLTKTLSLVEGAGKVEVIINASSGVKTVLATKKVISEINGQKTIEETPIIVNGKTVVLYEEFPDITGVIIVAEGGNKIATINKLQQATISLLKIDVSQIEIMLMK